MFILAAPYDEGVMNGYQPSMKNAGRAGSDRGIASETCTSRLHDQLGVLFPRLRTRVGRTGEETGERTHVRSEKNIFVYEPFIPHSTYPTFNHNVHIDRSYSLTGYVLGSFLALRKIEGWGSEIESMELEKGLEKGLKKGLVFVPKNIFACEPFLPRNTCHIYYHNVFIHRSHPLTRHLTGSFLALRKHEGFALQVPLTTRGGGG